MFTIGTRTSIHSRAIASKTRQLDGDFSRQSRGCRCADGDRARGQAALGLSRTLDRELAGYPDNAPAIHRAERDLLRQRGWPHSGVLPFDAGGGWGAALAS